LVSNCQRFERVGCFTFFRGILGTVSHDAALSPGDDEIKKSNLMVVQFLNFYPPKINVVVPRVGEIVEIPANNNGK